MNPQHSFIAYISGINTFKVAELDLLVAPVEAIVITTNPGILTGYGLSEEVERLAGSAYTEACEHYLEKKGPLSPMQAVLTTAGNLNFRAVIHAVGPQMSDGIETKIARTIGNALKAAEARGIRSVAFPPISTGMNQVPLKACAEGFRLAIPEYWARHPDSAIHEIWLCLQDEKQFEAFKYVLANMSTVKQVETAIPGADQDATAVNPDIDQGAYQRGQAPAAANTPGPYHLPVGYDLQGYVIEGVLGQGGFGIVYKARHLDTGEVYAIKEYLPKEFASRSGDLTVTCSSPENIDTYNWGLDRFLEEALSLQALKHPSIVDIIKVLAENNTAYIVMHYEDGDSLRQRLTAEYTLGEKDIIRILSSLMQALEIVHSNGYLHRDIKPANIYMRQDGTPVLLDFGSARQLVGAHTHTVTSLFSRGYTAHEQYNTNSKEQGPWSDIYSLAATIFHCMTGVMPVDVTDRSYALGNAQADPLDVRGAVDGSKYSADLIAGIEHGLRLKRTERPASIGEWRQSFGALFE